MVTQQQALILDTILDTVFKDATWKAAEPAAMLSLLRQILSQNRRQMAAESVTNSREWSLEVHLQTLITLLFDELICNASNDSVDIASEPGFVRWIEQETNQPHRTKAGLLLLSLTAVDNVPFASFAHQSIVQYVKNRIEQETQNLQTKISRQESASSQLLRRLFVAKSDGTDQSAALRQLASTEIIPRLKAHLLELSCQQEFELCVQVQRTLQILESAVSGAVSAVSDSDESEDNASLIRICTTALSLLPVSSLDQYRFETFVAAEETAQTTASVSTTQDMQITNDMMPSPCDSDGLLLSPLAHVSVPPSSARRHSVAAAAQSSAADSQPRDTIRAIVSAALCAVEQAHTELFAVVETGESSTAEELPASNSSSLHEQPSEQNLTIVQQPSPVVFVPPLPAVDMDGAPAKASSAQPSPMSKSEELGGSIVGAQHAVVEEAETEANAAEQDNEEDAVSYRSEDDTEYDCIDHDVVFSPREAAVLDPSPSSATTAAARVSRPQTPLLNRSRASSTATVQSLQAQRQTSSRDERNEVMEHIENAKQLRQRADELFVRNRFDEAIPLLEKALAEHSDTVIDEYSEPVHRAVLALFCRGRAYEMTGKYEQALTDFNRALDIDPSFSRCLLNRGKLLFEFGYQEAALKDFSRVIELDPTNLKAYKNRGMVYRDFLNQYSLAISDFTKAIELSNEKDHKAFISRGRTFLLLNKPQEALVDLNRAVLLCSNDSYAYSNRGNVYYGLKQYKEAMMDYSRAIQLAPQNAVAWCSRGTCSYNLGKYEQALRDFDRALDLDKNYGKAYYYRSRVLKAIGRQDEGIADALKAKELGWSAQ